MKITDAKSFGKAIRERRKELHYTQAYLSECTGLSITFLSDLERGKPGIQLEKSIQVVTILGMDLFMEKRGE
ncbi:MAG: helix-turn-helix domain-containing protein [Clostridiales bacterium]|nr:helix-turn-helix domain-containing protein [Clostridiales bacterium]